MKGNIDKDICLFFDKIKGDNLNDVVLHADGDGINGIQVDTIESRFVKFQLSNTSDWFLDYKCKEEETISIRDIKMWLLFMRSFDKLLKIETKDDRMIFTSDSDKSSRKLEYLLVDSEYISEHDVVESLDFAKYENPDFQQKVSTSFLGRVIKNARAVSSEFVEIVVGKKSMDWEVGQKGNDSIVESLKVGTGDDKEIKALISSAYLQEVVSGLSETEVLVSIIEETEEESEDRKPHVSFTEKTDKWEFVNYIALAERMELEE